MNNFSRFTSVSYKFFYSLFTIALVWIIFLNTKVNILREPVILVLVFLISVSFYYIWIRIPLESEELTRNNQSKSFEIIGWFLLFSFISVIGLTLRVAPGWDYGFIHRSALEWAKTGHLEDTSYFARYPNNNLILIITTILYKVIHLVLPSLRDSGYVAISIVFNSLMITTAIFFTSLSAKKLFGIKSKSLAVIFLILFTPVIFYAEILYTDTVGLLIISCIAFLLVKFLENPNYMDLTLMSLLFIFGYKIKAFIAIILVAFLIVIFLKEKIHLKKKMIYISIILISFIFGNIILSKGLDKLIGLDQEQYNQYQFPMVHWITMSLNPKSDGGFIQDDFELIKDTHGVKNKENLSKEILKNRVKELGTKGLLQHVLVKKMDRTWTKGSMAIDDYAQRENVNSTILHDFFTLNGKHHHYYYVFSQATHLIMIILILVSTLFSFFKRKEAINVFSISIFGLALFLVIWECNSRYLYSFIPLFTLVSLNGIAMIPKKNSNQV